MTNVNLGELPDPYAKRDAIHIAVAPMVAGEDLSPGDHVVLREEHAVKADECTLGIVDPFLKTPLRKGERFWLLLHPETVTGMRHHWDHPEFSIWEGSYRPSKEESERWLREFVEDNKLPNFEDVVKACLGEITTSFAYFEYRDEALIFRNISIYAEIPTEFWEHLENYTGQKVTTRYSRFSCSC